MTDPRDELIRVYEERLKALVDSSDCRGDEDCDHCEAIKALAQGAEIKKRMEEGKP